MEMEHTRRLEALLKLRERLCRETEPWQLYKTLKKLCSQAMLGDILEEIGFRQKIKFLKKQQIVAPFAKELAARSTEAEIHSNSPEDELQNPAFLRPRENGSQVLEVSSSSPQHSTNESMETSSKQIATGSPNVESAGRRMQTHPDNQLDTERQVRVGKPHGTFGEPWPLEGMKTLSSKPEDGQAKQRLALLRAKSPGPWIQEDHPPGSSDACLNYDCSPSSSALPPRKRKRKSSRSAEAHSPGAKVPRDMSPSFKDQNLQLTARPFPETTANLQTCFLQDGPEHSSLYTVQEAAPWACRKNFKTPVYSGGRPARALAKNSYQGSLAKQHSRCETHCQPALEEGSHLSQPQEDSPQTHISTAKRMDSQTESQTHLKMQDSLELRLQALCARIQSTQTKEPQGRQTKKIDFQGQATWPGDHADSGPRPEASTDNVQSLPEASGPGLLHRAPCQCWGSSSKCRNKTRPMKPALLMAKALKDYKNWSARK
ncbi:RNA polymerase II transcription factor SIII subunit A3-like-2 [Cricetulus griseus]|uniref:RNA polymerase II transcription factor SIII subunit A3-like-2 n=1 Tax=Cricetulus griseus TaxID=10029 RepID=G3IJN9_CRIGR|nr:RNA polymerase II transcription factor SIII subunit A3-like-2 [Cricetulus griseus]